MKKVFGIAIILVSLLSVTRAGAKVMPEEHTIDNKGNMHYVFHAHNSKEKVHPRCMYITRMAIKRSGKKYYPVISNKYRVPKVVNE